MTFMRTPSGVSNLNLFYSADLVVFTEGGTKTYTIDEISEDKFNKQSVDIKFWKSVFDSFGFQEKVQFRAIGSKTASDDLCKMIISNKINNIVVTRDKDLDVFFGNIHESPYILYTKGYSWENDIFSRRLIQELIESMLFLDETPQEVHDIVDGVYTDFARFGRHIAKLEVNFRLNEMKFVSGLSAERFFNAKKSPSIIKDEIKAYIKERKQELPANRNCLFKIELCPFMNNYGKLIQTLSLTLVSYIYRFHSDLKAFSIDLITVYLIDKFKAILQVEGDGYYADLINRLIIARQN